MTKINAAANEPTGHAAPKARSKWKRLNPDQFPIIRMRVTIGADDVALLPLYNVLMALPSAKSQRLHVRQILLQGLAAAPVAGRATQAPNLPATIADPPEPQPTRVTPAKGAATHGGGKAEIFKKLNMLD